MSQGESYIENIMLILTVIGHDNDNIKGIIQLYQVELTLQIPNIY